jgi:magnesium transporter
LRIFHVAKDQFIELPELPTALPDDGFLWIGTDREEFEVGLVEVQSRLLAWCGAQLVDLHVSDLLNRHLPSHYDYTSWYDLMVFRRLAVSPLAPANGLADGPNLVRVARPTLPDVDTRPVGFAVFDRVLLTVHPADCAVRHYFAQRMSDQQGGLEARGASRMPASPADLMLRMVNHMVDSYLELRRQLTRQLGTLQKELLDPKSRFSDWHVLLDSRNALHELEDTCDDQRSAVQEWLDALEEWPLESGADERHERELLRLRSRDVLEHVERVLSHVRRLGQSAEVAVQMHFSAIGYRTNNIMRTLTVLTAVFLPMNLITGFFGMNFDGLPLIHSATGVWIAAGMMLIIAVALGSFFWRQRYLGSSRRP